MRKIAWTGVFLFCVNIVFAQATFKQLDVLKSYKEAEELIVLGRYAVAYPVLADFIDKYQNKTLDKSNLIYATAVYYKALCEKQTGAKDAERNLIYFIDNFKGHAQISSAYYHIGDIAYLMSDYKTALEYFDKVEESSLNDKEKADFQFKRAFANFALKKFTLARQYFNSFSSNKLHPYAEDANYYAGLSSYYLKEDKNALKSFQQLESSKKYGKVIPYYIASIKFNNKEYQGVVEYAAPKLKQSIANNNELMHLLGSSYFELKDYKKVLFYLDQYISNATKVSPDDYYMLGYAAAKEGEYSKAIPNVLQLSPLQTALAQQAMFLLGQCYQKIGNKVDARTAFLQAARMNFDKSVQEEAWFQYAKLSYELGNTNDALVAFKNFIQNYPKSIFTVEANELLADLFMMTRNYEDAMSVIEGLSVKSSKLLEAYQKMAYYRGVENFNDYKFIEANLFFDKSLRYIPSKSIEALCYYWKADIEFQQSDYNASVILANKFLSLAAAVSKEHSDKVNAGTGNYLQGYNYFKKKDYLSSNLFFTKALPFLKTDNNLVNRQNLYPDAVLRLADGYFMQKQYKQAAQYYDELIKSNSLGADYALYQKSILLGLDGDYTAKIIGMKSLVARFPNSTFVDDAIMQSGNTLMALDKEDEAIDIFKSLLIKNPKSDRIPEAYLKIGLIYFNRDNTQESLIWYQKVLQLYPGSPAASEALLAIKEIYIANGDPNGFIKFASKYPGLQISASEQDSILYLAAENQFFKGNTDKALEGFNQYLKQFPNGYFIVPAHFYAAECGFAKKDTQFSLAEYEYVINQAQNKFTERALSRAAYIAYYQLKNFTRAHEFYVLLQPIASLDDNKREAAIGLMRTAFYMKNYKECLEVIGKVLQLPALPAFYQTEIAYYKGVSLFQLKDYSNALKELEVVVRSANNEQAAASKYMMARIHYLLGDKVLSEKECNEYLELFPSYEYYLGKAFILLSDLYKDASKMLQSKATLQSLLDNYSQVDDVKEEAQQKLDIIIQAELDNSKLKLEDSGSQIQFEGDNK